MPDPVSAAASIHVLIVGDAAHPAAPVEAAFGRYRTAGGLALDISSGRAVFLDSIRGSADPRGHLVIWDGSAGMPPKEIEILVHGLASGEWRMGTRRAALSVSRSGAGMGRAFRKAAGALRRAAGLPSESNPPCFAVPVPFVRSHADRLSAAPEKEWAALMLRAARREGVRVVEAPVMSAS
jgi:hypothetical protein